MAMLRRSILARLLLEEAREMVRRIDLGTGHRELFAEPAPLGLIGLAIGCAALTPIAFGESLTPQGLSTAAIFCLLFGGGGQLLAGLMAFANRNLYGGTLFTAFSFNWGVNWWILESLAQGRVPDGGVLLATEVLFLLVFVVLTYGFGFLSKILFVFLLDIDLLFLAKVGKSLTGAQALDLPIALLTVALGLLSLWIAFAALINPTAGRSVFRVPGPLFVAPRPPGFDWSLRRALFEVLYAQWRERAFEPLPFSELDHRVRSQVPGRSLLPDLHYLAELGSVVMAQDGAGRIEGVRLSAAGIDLYEQLVLKKYD